MAKGLKKWKRRATTEVVKHPIKLIGASPQLKWTAKHDQALPSFMTEVRQMVKGYAAIDLKTLAGSSTWALQHSLPVVVVRELKKLREQRRRH